MEFHIDNKTIRVFGAVCLALFVLLSGCDNKPLGMPTLRPCSIHVTDGQEPIPNTQINLFPLEVTANLACSGRTDHSGTAVMKTLFGSYNGIGVPEGSYRVVLSESIEMPHFKTKEERAAMSIPDSNAYNIEVQKRYEKIPKRIPTSLTRPNEESPLLTVTADGGKLKINVADYK